MKRFVASVVILALLTGLSVFDLDRRTSALMVSLTSVEEQLSQWDQEETLREMEALYRQWQDHEDAMTHFVRHDQLESISSLLERALALARYNDPTDLAADLAEARHHLEHLRVFELPSLGE